MIISILDTETQGVVLDPYVGSGTTAVAAKLLGHTYIGIDRSVAYLEMTLDRLANAPNEMPKIQEELALHNVETTAQERRVQGKNMGKYRPTNDEKDDRQGTLFEGANDSEL